MIKSLQRKFILIASGCVLMILTVVLLCINIISYYSGYNESMAMLSFIAENNGRMPDRNPENGEVDFFVSREMRFETRYFSVIVDTDGNIVDTDNEHIDAVTDEEAETMYTQVFAGNKTQGNIKLSDSYFLYKVRTVNGSVLNDTVFSDSDTSVVHDDTDYRLIVFMDCTNRFYRINTMRYFSVLLGEICFAVFIILITVISGKAVKPAAENYEKQKQFITNAGHELKTPLTIISANAEVIEATSGQSEWTESIRNQVMRLTGLINDLIAIAKLDESADSHNMQMEPFDLSGYLSEASDDFRTVAEQHGKKLETEIDPDIMVNGNVKTLKELISILLDNAAKYCDDGGIVRAELKRQKNRVCVIVSNTHAKKTDCSRFFERFYRGDTSHNSENAGYGIGLSMAEMIVRLHKGKITAYQKDGNVYFNVFL